MSKPRKTTRGWTGSRKTPPRHGPSFGRTVLRLRKARGLTQEALAERADLTSDSVRRIEHGVMSPSLDTLAKLATGLGCELSALFAAFERSDDGPAREILSMARRMSSSELALAVRLLSVLASMLRVLTIDAGSQE